MGDGADDAIDRSFDDEELYHEVKHDRQRLYEEGFINENGTVNNPSMFKIEKPVGPGLCPICGGPTAIKINSKLKVSFYGCLKYPSCRGNRNY